MSIATDIANLVGGNLADGIAKIISLFKVDPNQALEKQTEILKIQADLQSKIVDSVIAQAQVNAAEASSKSIFVAGWRPFVGWTCGSALAYTFIVQPFLTFVLVATHSTFDATKLPTLNIADLMTVLTGMLGLAAARTVEKVNGVSSGH